MTKYGKLVRDKIPERIEAEGKACTWHTAASDAEFREMLGQKLLEEVSEFCHEPSDDELADVTEVVEAIIRFDGIDRSVLLDGYSSVRTFTAEEFADKDFEFDLISELDDLAVNFVARPTPSNLVVLLSRLWEVAHFQGLDRETVERERLAKRETHGAFEERIILDEA